MTKELVSTWGKEGEEGLLHGLIEEEQLPSWLQIGGDVRAVQVHREDARVKEGRFIWMQADLEAAVTIIDHLTVAGSIGRVEDRNDVSLKSRYYYAMYRLKDELTIRAGRFFPAFGLLIADHFYSTRRGLGFDQGNETMNLEAAWVGEAWNFFVTALQSPGEVDQLNRRQGIATQATYAFQDSNKIGLSVMADASDVNRRTAFGTHAILGFRHDLYLLSEVDFQSTELKSASGTNRESLFATSRVAFEATKGVHLLAIHDYSQSDRSQGQTARDAFGAGIQLFPRPHFEFQGVWLKQRSRARDGVDDYAYLLAHYYF
jgi:hypothetical protein